MRPIYIATEDEVSEAVAERLVDEVNDDLFISVRMRRGGNSYLRAKLPGLVGTAEKFPVFLLTDLDRLPCPSALIAQWCGALALPESLVFRVAVREVESWLLADNQAFAEFFGVPGHRLPAAPETLADPKRELMTLVRRHGRRAVKQHILPDRRSTAAIGPGYSALLATFVRELWEPARAATRSESLARARMRLGELPL